MPFSLCSFNKFTRWVRRATFSAILRLCPLLCLFSPFIQTTQASELCYCDFSIQCFDFPSKSLRFFTSKVYELLITRSSLNNLQPVQTFLFRRSDDEFEGTLLWCFFLTQRRENVSSSHHYEILNSTHTYNSRQKYSESLSVTAMSSFVKYEMNRAGNFHFKDFQILGEIKDFYMFREYFSAFRKFHFPFSIWSIYHFDRIYFVFDSILFQNFT